jgi:hypothetical protein
MDNIRKDLKTQCNIEKMFEAIQIEMMIKQVKSQALEPLPT